MEHARFVKLAAEAMAQLPDELRAHLDNVDLVVEDWPTTNQLAITGLGQGDLVLGLYEGVPLTERYDYGMVLPDKITLFQRSLEAICATDDELVEEIRRTVIHEVAHHFGIDDDALAKMGR